MVPVWIKVTPFFDAEYLRNGRLGDLRHTQQCHFEWPSMTLSDLAKDWMTATVPRSLCNSWAYCFVKTMHYEQLIGVSFGLQVTNTLYELGLNVAGLEAVSHQCPPHYRALTAFHMHQVKTHWRKKWTGCYGRPPQWKRTMCPPHYSGLTAFHMYRLKLQMNKLSQDVQRMLRQSAAADCRSASTECDAAAASRCDTAGGTGNDYRVLYYGDERSLI